MPSAETDLRNFHSGDINFSALTGKIDPASLGEAFSALEDIEKAERIKLLYSICDGYIEARRFEDGSAFIKSLLAFGELDGEVKAEGYLLGSEMFAYRSYFEAAAEYLDNVKSFYKERNDTAKILRIHTDLSAFLKRRGEYGRAIEEAEAGLALTGDDGDPKWRMRLWNNLGLVLKETGDFKGSIDALKKSVELAKELKVARVLAANLVNIGTLYNRIERNDQAIDFMKRALEEWTGIGNQREIARCMNNLGNYLMDNSPDEAAVYLEKGAGIAEDGGFKDVQIAIHFNLGLIRKKSNDHPDLVAEFNKARELAREAGDKDYEWRSLAELGKSFLKNGDLAESDRSFRNAAEIMSSMRLDLSEEMSIGFMERREEMFTDLIELDLARGEQVQAMIDFQKIKAITLSEISLKDPEVVFDHDDLSEINEFCSTNGIIALDYFINGDKLLTGVIGGSEPELVVSEFDLSKFEKLISGLNERIKTYEISPELREDPSKPDDKTGEILEKLYEILISPVRDRIDATRYIAFIPHGVIGELPIPALKGPDGYLAEEYILSVFPNLTLASMILKFEKKHIDKLLLSIIRGDSTGLESVDAEISHIEKEFPGKVIHSDLEELRSISRASHEWVHYAGHAEFKSTLYGPSLKGDMDRDYLPMMFDWEPSPLILFLAGCQTGQAVQRGFSERVGVARMMFKHGTIAVVSSLWQISDRHTSEFVSEFYSSLNGASSISEVLATAMRTFIKKNWHPYFWAGFALEGDVQFEG